MLKPFRQYPILRICWKNAFADTLSYLIRRENALQSRRFWKHPRGFHSRKNDMKNRIALHAVGLLLLTAALGVAGYGDEFRPRQVLRKPLPAITRFPIVSAEKAAGKINDAELVLGVALGKEARAYPINMLTGPSREILNDTLAKRPIAATW